MNGSRATSTPATPPTGIDRYDVYDAACLAGGPDRVVDTALVVLVQSGRVRLGAGGELYAVALTRRHPVEAAVLDTIGPRPRRSAGTVRWRAAQDPRVADVAERLRQDGLLRPRRLLRRAGGAPVPTAAGRRTLRRLRDRPAGLPGAGRSPSATAVALRGTAALPDGDLRTLLRPPAPPSRLRGGGAHWDARADVAWTAADGGGWAGAHGCHSGWGAGWGDGGGHAGGDCGGHGGC